MAGGQRHRGGLALLGLLLVVAGCARKNVSVASTFPTAAMAAPWILTDDVWSGSFEEAAAALGEDADQWRPFAPARVWLAVYHHQSLPGKKLTARAFSFETPDAARRAFEYIRPPDAKEFGAGDEGCWTQIGVLFVWGRLVFDIFGTQACLSSEIQSARLTAFIQDKMPPELPDAPR